jgi:hypothetical protein
MFSSAGRLLNKTQLSKLEIFGTIFKKTPPLAQNADVNPDCLRKYWMWFRMLPSVESLAQKPNICLWGNEKNLNLCEKGKLVCACCF